MCGRFTLRSKASDVAKVFGLACHSARQNQPSIGRFDQHGCEGEVRLNNRQIRYGLQVVGLWQRARNGVRISLDWAEDRATVGTDLGAVSGAKTEWGGTRPPSGHSGLALMR